MPDAEGDFAKLPVPCTTKVSMYENDTAYRAFVAQFRLEFAVAEQTMQALAPPRRAVRAAPRRSPMMTMRHLYDAAILLKSKFDATSLEELLTRREASNDTPVTGMEPKIHALRAIAELLAPAHAEGMP